MPPCGVYHGGYPYLRRVLLLLPRVLVTLRRVLSLLLSRFTVGLEFCLPLFPVSLLG